MVSIIAFIVCIIPMIFEKQFGKLFSIGYDGWIALIWYGSIVTVIGFSLMFYGSKYCNGYTIAAFTGLIPVSSLVLSIIILKESVTINQIAGCACIVFSIFIMSLDFKNHSS